MKTRKRSRRPSVGVRDVLSRTGADYCENSTVHGFSYWIKSARIDNALDRAFWVLISLLSFFSAGIILHTTITDWIENPAG